MNYSLKILCLALLAVPAAAATPAGVRNIFIAQGDGKACFAVGDNSLALKSTDSGKTWQPLKLPQETAHLQSVCTLRDGAEMLLMGGSALMGYPQGGAGRGVIMYSQFGEDSFRLRPAGITGWIYCGIFAKARGAVGGQAASDALGGLFNTFSAGKIWLPLATSSRGYILGGAFDTWKSGYMVGTKHRIINLQNLNEPKINVPRIPSPWPLRAAAIAPDKTCWAVGDNGSILTSDKPDAPWPVRPISLPAGTALVCDFENIDISGDKIAIAGGLNGAVFISTDGGLTFAPQPIPANMPVRCLKWLDKNTLLAGTDGGAIWRSDDSGKTWQKTTGGDETDLLIVASAQERGIYPVIRAHADCGVRVAVLFATVPNYGESIPAEQQLRAAALQAGASSVAFMGDFESFAGDDLLCNLNENALSEKWSKLLDIDPKKQMATQIAAAVRLYKPRAVAAGFYADGYRGKPAEIAFVARSAELAVSLAAEKNGMKNFHALNLLPHKIDRLFTACESNENTSVPWAANNTNPALKKCPFAIDTTRTINDQPLPLCFQSAVSAWMTGGSLLDRPARLIAYNSPDVKKRKVLLMTQGLTSQRMKLEKVSTDDALLANGGLITFADGEDRLPVIMNELLAIFNQKDEAVIDRKLLAADNLALILYRLASSGRLVQAVQSLQTFLEYGKKHPLHEMLRVSSIATLSSSEFRAQMAMMQLDKIPQINTAFIAEDLGKTADTSPWLNSPQGMALTAALYRKINQQGQADHIMRRMLDANFSTQWDSYIRSERTIRAGKAPQDVGNRKLFKPEQIKGKMEIDGLLDDEVWQNATQLIMTDNDKAPGELIGYAMLVRNKTELVVALKLPNATARKWEITIGIDSDRDTWVQELIQFNSLGETSTQTVPMAGPVWTIDKRNVLLKKLAAPEDDMQTFEIVFPLKHFDAEIDSRDYWAFQIMAVADGPDGRKAIYLQPQDSPQMLPHRYGLLDVSPKTGK